MNPIINILDNCTVTVLPKEMIFEAQGIRVATAKYEVTGSISHTPVPYGSTTEKYNSSDIQFELKSLRFCGENVKDTDSLNDAFQEFYYDNLNK